MIYVVLPLISAIFVLFICLLVIFRSQSKVNIIFSLFCLATSVWLIGTFMMFISKTDDSVVFWDRFLYIGVVFMPTICYHFGVELIRMSEKKKILIYISYILSTIFFILSRTNLFISGVYKYSWGMHSQARIFHDIFLIYFICIVYLLFYDLYNFYKKNTNLVEKNKIKYVFVALAILSLGSVGFLPAYGINVFPLFYLSGVIFTIIISYGIIKYRLLDIRLAISGFFYYVILIFIYLCFIFLTFYIIEFFNSEWQIWITFFSTLIIVFSVDPLKHLLAKLTDNFFYKGKIDYQEVLKDVSQEIAGELDLDDLLTNLGINLQKQLKLKNVRVFLQDDEKNSGAYHSYQPDNAVSLAVNDPLIKYFQANKEIIVTEELVRKKNDSRNPEEAKMLEIVERRLEELRAALAVPVFSKEKLSSLLLVEDKLSGGIFSQDDLSFFSVLAPQIAVALEKSKLFEEVQSAKINLEHLVEQRTRDLKDRNRYLLALQRLINLTTRSLDFQKVMQTIADGISTELGFIGGMLNFIDFQRGVISVKAISNTPAIMEVQKFITRSPESYNISLREENNLAVKAILQKGITSGVRFADFLSSAIEPAISDKIQTVLGIKTILAVPIYSEERVIGVIDFVLADDINNIKDVEREMMKSLADQVGIVYRNLSLYNQINLANQDLKQANVRLTQLDKSKSEFLSIASHQLRTPLTGIKGYLSMIIAGDFGAVSAKILKVLNDVFMNTDRLTRLINVFLNVSRIESGRFEITKQDIDLTALIMEVIDAMKPSAEQKQLTLTFHRPNLLLPNIPVDRDKIKDVILNLVDNAIKYTPKGSIDVSAVSLGDALQVTIKDTGIGIAEGQDRELFKKFVRGDGVAQINTGGSGLGLFIAKKIVEAHGGKIWVESAGKNMGSSFIFTLPKK